MLSASKTLSLSISNISIIFLLSRFISLSIFLLFLETNCLWLRITWKKWSSKLSASRRTWFSLVIRFILLNKINDNENQRSTACRHISALLFRTLTTLPQASFPCEQLRKQCKNSCAVLKASRKQLYGSVFKNSKYLWLTFKWL